MLDEVCRIPILFQPFYILDPGEIFFIVIIYYFLFLSHCYQFIFMFLSAWAIYTVSNLVKVRNWYV